MTIQPFVDGGRRPSRVRRHRGRVCSIGVAIAAMMTGSVVAGAPAAAAAPPAQISPNADTYVVQESSLLRGSETKINAAVWASPAWHTQAYLRFTVPATPAGYKIGSASLTLTYQKLTQQAPETRLHKVTGAWSEATTTWANKPTIETTALTSAFLSAPGASTLTFTLDSVITAPATYDFALVNPGTESATAVYSREQGASAPKLTVNYVPLPPTLFGASFEVLDGQTFAQALAAEDVKYNGMDVVRLFNPGLPPAWTGSKQAQLGARPVVVSFKMAPSQVLSGQHDAYMTSWFAGIPTDRDVYWSYWHEPEDEVADGTFTAADYKAAWQRLKQLEDSVANPRLFATLALMRWSLRPESGRDWETYYAGDATIDVISWDAYNLNPEAGYMEPNAFMAEILAVAAETHKPWGIAELGSRLDPTDDGTLRAVWLSQLGTIMKDNSALWVAYFDLDWSTGDIGLRDPASIAVWAGLCTQP